MTALTLYRCQECGKWSHAKRRPTRHRRLVPDHGQIAPAEFLEREHPKYDHMNGFTRDGGWWVNCGPFDAYKAVKVA